MPEHRKATLYLDQDNFDQVDDLLTLLKKAFGLPRDQSMLVRALIIQAAANVQDPAELERLAEACKTTLPQTTRKER